MNKSALHSSHARVAALLTGRGNNTLPDKNIRHVDGRPLLAYPCMAAARSVHIDHFYVSSDDEKILAEAAVYGYRKIVRPNALAAPDAQHVDTLLHALDVMRERDQYEPDLLVIMLANNACIKTTWIDQCIEMLLADSTLSAITPANQDSDHHPYRAKRINSENLFEPFFDFYGKDISTNRQDLDPSYFLCHNFWVLRVEASLHAQEEGQQPWSFMGNRIAPLIVAPHCFDVHSEDDLFLTERWLNRHGDAGVCNNKHV